MRAVLGKGGRLCAQLMRGQSATDDSYPQISVDNVRELCVDNFGAQASARYACRPGGLRRVRQYSGRQDHCAELVVPPRGVHSWEGTARISRGRWLSPVREICVAEGRCPQVMRGMIMMCPRGMRAGDHVREICVAVGEASARYAYGRGVRELCVDGIEGSARYAWPIVVPARRPRDMRTGHAHVTESLSSLQVTSIFRWAQALMWPNGVAVDQTRAEDVPAWTPPR